MTHSFLNDLDALYIVIILFFSMITTVWIGHKFGLKKQKAKPQIPSFHRLYWDC